MDAGHKLAESELRKLQNAIWGTYGAAKAELKSKLKQSMSDYENGLSDMTERVAAGKAKDEDLKGWKQQQLMHQGWLKDMVEQLSMSMLAAEKTAAHMSGETSGFVFAENVNYGMYEIEQGYGIATAFTLMDEQTARMLLAEKPDLYPQPSVNEVKAKRWSKKKFQSQLTQGILQGETIPAIAKRVEIVLGMSMASSMRVARTATTGAENAGRVRSYKQAQALGLNVLKQWMSAEDSRVRPEHAARDGQSITIDEEFVPGLSFPGDPRGPGHEVYNCRCTLVADLPDFADLQGIGDANSEAEAMSYEEWKRSKAALQRAREARESAKAPDSLPDWKDWKRLQAAQNRKHAFVEQFRDAMRGLSDDERNAIEVYTGNAFADINGALRRGGTRTVHDYAYGELTTDQLAERISSALNKLGTTEDMYLTRNTRRNGLSVDGVTFDDVFSGNASLVGRTFADNGFLSSATWTGGVFNGNLVLHIMAPKGTPGAYVASVSRHASEKEFLFDRGQKFTVLGQEVSGRKLEVWMVAQNG